jgi:anti-sigma regulatory factor (Ser/Thr protein kinase)
MLTLDPYPDSVRIAREFCVRELGPFVGTGEEAEELLGDATMVTSELVTNAIQAGASQVQLVLEAYPHTMRISVVDDARGEVAPVASTPLASHGRGLRIVESLAVQWGVDAESSGKTVWADLSLAMTAATAS